MIDLSRIAPHWRPYWKDAYWLPLWEGQSDPVLLTAREENYEMDNTGSSWILTPKGPALEDTAANQEIRLESIPSWMKPTDGATLIWVGEAGSCSSMTGLWGVYYDNAGGSPYATYLMARPSDSTSMGLWANSGGTWQNVSVTNGIANDGQIHAYVATINVASGAGKLWRDGRYIGSVSYTQGSINYASTASIILQGHSGATDRYPNVQSVLAGAIMRPLSDDEAAELAVMVAQEPFGIITPTRKRGLIAVQTSLTEALEGFRFVNNNGDEDESTFAALQDVNFSVAPNGVIRLRVIVQGITGGVVQLDGALDGTSDYWKIE